MNARTVLVRGLLAGLVAGFAAFLVAYTVGEPPVEAAIALETAGSGEEASAPHSHDEAVRHDHGTDEGSEDHAHGEEGGITRHQQSTWGLLTGTLCVGLALGGILALVAAAVAGRWGRLSVAASTALVIGIGFVAVALVPFLKYPAAPPAVGSGDTIGERTASYFTLVLIAVLAAVGSTALVLRLRRQVGDWGAVVAGIAAFTAVCALTAGLMPTVDEVGDFPASILWEFRIGSLLTLATLWGVLGIALSGMLGRLADRERAMAQAEAARKEFAMSL